MAKFEFDKIVTVEEMKNMIEKDLGSEFHVKVNNNRIEIKQDATKGCAIQLQEKDGKTICKPYGYMPSGGIRLAITFPLIAGSVLVGFASGYVIIGGLGPVLAILIMKAPSLELVERVSKFFEKLARRI